MNNGFAIREEPSAEPYPAETYDFDAECLSSCLSFLTSKSPDLATIVEHWDRLPGALKAGIVAMVKAAETQDREEVLPSCKHQD